jgi:hypothetical protein
MTQNTSSETRTGNQEGSALGRFLRVLLRLIFVLVIGVGLGLLVYYGSVAFYQGWIRQAQWVQRNSALITILQERLDREGASWEEKVQTLESQVAMLEADLAALEEVSNARTETLTTMDQAIAHLDRQVEQNQQRIEQESLALQAQLDAVNATLDDVQEAADAYVAKLETAEAQIAALDAAIEAEQEAVVSAMNAADQDDVLALETQVTALEKRLILFQIAQDLLSVRWLVLEDGAQIEGLLTETTTAHLDQAIELMPAHAETLTGLRARVLALDPLMAQGAADALPALDALWQDLMEVMTAVTGS